MIQSAPFWSTALPYMINCANRLKVVKSILSQQDCWIKTEHDGKLHLRYIKSLNNDTEPFIKWQNNQLLAVSDITM